MDPEYNRDIRTTSIHNEYLYSNLERLTLVFSYALLAITFPISMIISFRIVQGYQRGILFRFGKVRVTPIEPGMCFILPCTDDFFLVDLRTVSYDVPPQEVITRDAVTVAVDAVVYYSVFDPLLAVVRVYNYTKSTHFLAATTLRNVLGNHTMAELLQDREALARAMELVLDIATDPWGVKVERVEIKEVSLPAKLQRTMAAEAEAMREAKAKVLAAEGEFNAAKALSKASRIMLQSPAALQLRYLQTLVTVASDRSTTIVFPLPMDLITPFFKTIPSTQQVSPSESLIESVV